MKRWAVLFSIALILGAVIWVVPSHLVRYGLAFPLLWLLPGLSWASLIPRHVLDRVERLVVGLGLNFVITPTVTLLVTYLPGPVTRASLLAAVVGVIGLPGILLVLIYLKRRYIAAPEVRQADIGFSAPAKARRRVRLLDAQHPLWRDGWAWLLVAVVIAGGLRVVNLNYAEFEGDGAKVMVRAARALEGDEAIIFLHKKGPSQLTVVMSGWRLTGVANEWMVRLPFSWASTLGVVAVFLCGRRLGRPHAGGIAACMLAVEGFHVGLGRGPKYHSLVFALSTLGLLCLFVYYTRGRGGLVVIAAVFFAGGVLAHYDAILTLPAGLLLIAARLWLDRRQSWRVVIPVVVAALAAAVLMGLFYVPFLRGPHVGYTSSYVSGRIGGHVYNNLRSSFELSAVYNAIYLLAVMALALAGQTLSAWARWGRVGLLLSVVLLVAAATGLMWSELWVVKDLTLAWIPCAILLIGALLSPGQSVSIRAVWLWLGIPALFYLFFVAIPLTHVYTIFSGWAMLTGIGLESLGCWLVKRSRAALRIAGAGGVAMYVLCGFYAAMVFIDHNPEYLRAFPQSKSSVYWTPYYEQIPTRVGLYGFPYRAGWKVVGYLMDEGQLPGSYDSNEKPRATGYYTRQAVRLDCASPDMYIIAANVQDEIPIRWDQVETEYQPAIVVTVSDQPKLTIYARDVAGPPLTYRVEEYERLFDLNSTPERVARSASPAEIELMQMEEYVPREAVIGDFAHLLGYKIDAEHAVPGGYVELTLLWQALKPAPIDYQVFTHLYDGEMIRGQLDGQPVCDNQPTSRWQPGQIIADPYRIPIRGDAPTGSVPLTVGMYDLATMQRLPVSATDGLPAGDNVCLTDLVIRTP